MEKEQTFQRNAGFFTSFLNGICAISSGVVVSILQETYGSAYGMTGTLLSLVSIDSLLAGLTSGMSPVKTGTEKTVALPTADCRAGYMVMGFSGWILVLMLGFFMVNVVRGSTINTCTTLAADNSGSRAKDMNIMHNCYTLDALLCPSFIVAAMKTGNTVPMLVLAACGFLLWLTSYVTPAETKAMKKDWDIDKSFLKSRKFWMLIGLLLYRSTAETSVTDWMVTYFGGNSTISGSLSPHTVTVMWGAMLTARLLIAFVVPVRNSYSATVKMGIGCVTFYMGLMIASTQTTAILLLFAFTFVMTGMNPTVVASAGCMTSAASMGIMLPATSSSAIIMPWIIGTVSEYAGIEVGMTSNIISCASMLLFNTAVKRLKE